MNAIFSRTSESSYSSCWELSASPRSSVRIKGIAIRCLVKRFFEYPKRSWKVFLLDITKQAFSSELAHIMNLVLAVLLSSLVKVGDNCSWYFVNLTIDTTVGVFLCFMLITLVNNIARKYDIMILHSGHYFNEGMPHTDVNINYRIWVVQLTIWCIIVILVKITLFFVQLFFSSELEDYGELVLGGFKGEPEVELVFVMIIAPVVMNSVQYWVQDNFLKRPLLRQEEEAVNLKAVADAKEAD